MSSINKIKISSTTYDVSPSPDGTLSGYTSSDTSQSTAGTSYTSVEPISSSDDTNSTIFTKTTKMVKNIRVLYNKIGTTDISSIGSTITGAINSLNTSIAGKAAASHSHGVSDLPVSNQQSSSETLIPTAGLVNSMNTTLSGISAKYTMESSFTTNITCGGISSGTEINSSDTLRSTIKNLLYSSIDPTDPNTRYEDKSLGTWSTAAQVNTFFNTYTYAKNWTGLSVGNYVTISDGTYNVDWVIAGFNCERRADCGTTGGIVFIPRYVNLTTYNWHYQNLAVAYNDSYIHMIINNTSATHTATVYKKLYPILGSHIVQRNVTLGSSMSTTDGVGTIASTNTTAYLTLMSWGQLSGTFGSHNNSYDDGEANYKLPLFNFVSLSTYAGGNTFWLRNASGYNGSSREYLAWYVKNYGTTITNNIRSENGVRPLMYLVGDPVPQPSTEYEDKSLGTWSTAAQVNTFFNTYTYKTGWAGLKIGNYVTIKDGTYNKDWVIAGFNTETASDGVSGGIIFIPRYVNLTTYNWHTSSTTATPYKNSAIHTYINGTVYNNLSTILGSHIVQRNVTLGSACSGTSPRTWTTSATTSTTAYLTLMSCGQLSGTFASHNNSYDDGEANYKLPLFDNISISTYANSSTFWLRNVYGKYSSFFDAWGAYHDGGVRDDCVDFTYGVRPLIYLR